MSASNLLDLLEQGEILDSAKYDELKEKKMISNHLKAPKEQLIKDMNGTLSPTQALMVTTIRNRIREMDRDLATLDREIERLLSQDQKSACEKIKDIPGISDRSSQVIIAAIGTDMNQFPTAEHLASWAGLCPGNNESAGKRRNGRTNKGNKILKTTLVVAAHSAVKVKDSYFGALYAKLKVRRGSKRAIVAVAHSMLKTIYHMLKNNTVCTDLGADYFESIEKSKCIKKNLKKLQKLGVELTSQQKELIKNPNLQLQATG